MSKENVVRFSNRVTDVWDYPKLSRYNNEILEVENYLDILSEKNKSYTKDMRLYIHIPFCKSFCSFCQFYKEPCNNQSSMHEYVDAVIKEIQLYSATKYLSNANITSIYFGGGDPSCINNILFKKILAAVRKFFMVDKNASITVEGNILSLLSNDKIAMYKEEGISRISFGIQTFDENIRKKLLIKPSLDDIYHLIQLFKDVNFTNYTFDLMYNLPDQTMESLHVDLDKATALGAQYIDFFNLNVYPNTHFYQSIYEYNKFKIKPNKKNEYEMVKYIRNYMEKADYKQVCSITYSPREVTAHFGLEQFLKGSDMLGIGASARSFLYNKIYRNVCNVNQYIIQLNEGKFPLETGLSLGEDELQTRRIVLFPTLLKIKHEDIPENEMIHKKINLLTEAGYLKSSEQYLELTNEGKCWVGNIQKFFYEDKWRKNEFAMLLSSVKNGQSAYNQDSMGVKKHINSQEVVSR